MSTPDRNILLVEDDPNDIFFFKRAMAKAGFSLPVHVAENGKEAIDYLLGVGNYADRARHPIPHCIFLDLKMPFVGGFQFLEWLRTQPPLSNLRVIVLTSSPEQQDRERAAELGAKNYIVKPPSPQALIDALKAVPQDSPVLNNPA